MHRLRVATTRNSGARLTRLRGWEPTEESAWKCVV